MEGRGVVKLHVFPVVGVAAAVEGLFGPVVKAGNALQSVKENEGLGEFVRVAVGFIGGKETR